MKQKTLADKVGISPQHLYQYESDRRIPKLEMLTKIADALGTTAECLLESDTTTESFSCHYCDSNDNDWTHETVPVDMGDFGDHELLVWVSGHRKQLHVEFEEKGRDPILDVHFRIKYCPYCGRKL